MSDLSRRFRGQIYARRVRIMAQWHIGVGLKINYSARVHHNKKNVWLEPSRAQRKIALELSPGRHYVMPLLEKAQVFLIQREQCLCLLWDVSTWQWASVNDCRTPKMKQLNGIHTMAHIIIYICFSYCDLSKCLLWKKSLKAFSTVHLVFFVGFDNYMGEEKKNSNVNKYP